MMVMDPHSLLTNPDSILPFSQTYLFPNMHVPADTLSKIFLQFEWVFKGLER